MNWDPEKDVRIVGVGGLDAQMAGSSAARSGTIFGGGVVLKPGPASWRLDG
jgi:hypothetical protein